MDSDLVGQTQREQIVDRIEPDTVDEPAYGTIGPIRCVMEHMVADQVQYDRFLFIRTFQPLQDTLGHPL